MIDLQGINLKQSNPLYKIGNWKESKYAKRIVFSESMAISSSCSD
jgi:hypothetical protein